MDQLTWDDKDSGLPESDPRRNWRVVDILELKTKFNDNVEEAETELDAAASHISNTSNPHGVTKTQLGLDQVNNTSDANKPVSTAQATAIALKANIASPTFTGVPAGPTAAPGTNTTQFATTAFVEAIRILIPLLTSFVDNEVPTGDYDEVNNIYTLTHTPIAGSLHLFNPLAMTPNVHYTITGNTITCVVPPSSLLAHYRK